jgi:hypothetical protein
MYRSPAYQSPSAYSSSSSLSSSASPSNPANSDYAYTPKSPVDALIESTEVDQGYSSVGLFPTSVNARYHDHLAVTATAYQQRPPPNLPPSTSPYPPPPSSYNNIGRNDASVPQPYNIYVSRPFRPPEPMPPAPTLYFHERTPSFTNSASSGSRRGKAPAEPASRATDGFDDFSRVWGGAMTARHGNYNNPKDRR